MSLEARFRIQQAEFQLDVDLSLPMHGVTALFGKSGSGKTTLLRAIAGLDRHIGSALNFNGRVWQDGQQFCPPHLRSLGYVFQEASLFEHMTVRQNLLYARKRSKHQSSTFSIDNAIELLELQSLLARQPVSLSGGERQRVAIARALCCQPQLLLMDEPLAGLDYSAKQRLLPLIDSTLKELGVPCLYVSHSIDEVSYLADDLLLFDGGQVIAQGETQALLTQLDLPLAQQIDAESIVQATIQEHDEDYGLTYLDSDMGRFTIARKSAGVGSSLRVRILARDISLTLSPPTHTSILNIFPAKVVQLKAFGDAQVTVKLQINNTLILARITRKSADILNIKTGMSVYAQAKAVSLL